MTPDLNAETERSIGRYEKQCEAAMSDMKIKSIVPGCRILVGGAPLFDSAKTEPAQ